MWIEPFFAQGSPLFHTKAMLLIYYSQPQLPDLDVTLNYGVSPDQYVNPANAQLFENLNPLRTGRTTG
jgi:hypothetical protein